MSDYSCSQGTPSTITGGVPSQYRYRSPMANRTPPGNGARGPQRRSPSHRTIPPIAVESRDGSPEHLYERPLLVLEQRMGPSTLEEEVSCRMEPCTEKLKTELQKHHQLHFQNTSNYIKGSVYDPDVREELLARLGEFSFSTGEYTELVVSKVGTDFPKAFTRGRERIR